MMFVDSNLSSKRTYSNSENSDRNFVPDATEELTSEEIIITRNAQKISLGTFDQVNLEQLKVSLLNLFTIIKAFFYCVIRT